MQRSMTFVADIGNTRNAALSEGIYSIHEFFWSMKKNYHGDRDLNPSARICLETEGSLVARHRCIAFIYYTLKQVILS